MILKVNIKDLLKRFLEEHKTRDQIIMRWLEDFAQWLDDLDIEKVIGEKAMVDETPASPNADA